MDELQRHLHASAALEGRAQNLMAHNNLMECVHQSLSVQLAFYKHGTLGAKRTQISSLRYEELLLLRRESKTGWAGILHI